MSRKKGSPRHMKGCEDSEEVKIRVKGLNK
jgi:hypothetical protein